jgi:hypothetical protein
MDPNPKKNWWIRIWKKFVYSQLRSTVAVSYCITEQEVTLFKNYTGIFCLIYDDKFLLYKQSHMNSSSFKKTFIYLYPTSEAEEIKEN